jgi:AraC family ethanolamine operon transcriptional activator
MGQYLLVDSRGLDSFEDLQQAVHGSHVDVMQLGRGRLRGSLSHLGIGDFSLSIGAFSIGMRTRRIASDDRLIVGMLLKAEQRVTHWSFNMQPNDVLVIPPLVEHDGIFHGASAYAAMRFSLDEIPSLFGGEARLGDPELWRSKSHYRSDPAVGAISSRRLSQIVMQLRDYSEGFTTSTADFWKRSIAECVAANVMFSLPPDDDGWLPSARRLVRKVEDYLSEIGERPVHVAEICESMRVSRRTLYRAFHEVFGMGPVTFLRQKRLCTIHSILRDSIPGTTTVATVAIQQGFYELGRFSQYYHAMFGEYPSETLGIAAAGIIDQSEARLSAPVRPSVSR